MEFTRVTEQPSKYNSLEKMSTLELLTNINKEDQTVPFAVEKAIPQIEKIVDVIANQMRSEANGRLFYIGAGTSGRLGIVDASECRPTFGVDPDSIVGIIAGGDAAIRRAQEFAEDSELKAWEDLKAHNIDKKDIVIGISASGTTPYVFEGLAACQKNGNVTGCITCNPGAPITKVSNYPIEVEVGPEFITGSTRMKSGTAQKLVLNMISTSVMIKIGRVKDNRMVNMQLTNNKLIDRGVKMVMEMGSVSDEKATKDLLLKHGSVKKTLEALEKDNKA